MVKNSVYKKLKIIAEQCNYFTETIRTEKFIHTYDNTTSEQNNKLFYFKNWTKVNIYQSGIYKQIYKI